MMKKSNIFLAFLFVSLIFSSLLYNSCKKEDDTDDTIKLQSWGPSPALRGGEMKFIGNNLDQVTAVILPDNIEITTFKTKTSELLVIDVPEATMPGELILKTPQGDIIPLTSLGISEPITLDTILPAKVRPGDTVVINGDYLNLINEVIFSAKKSVKEFISKSKNQIKVKVPVDAQSGVVILSNGAVEPIQVESKFAFEVAVPKIAAISPNPVKAGESLTISGTDLDLTNKIFFGGDKLVTSFFKEKTSITVAVPSDARDGVVTLVPLSLVEAKSSDTLRLVVPTISSISPNPGKNNSNITVVGTNLDVVTSVTFAGNKTGTIKEGGTATQMDVQVPTDALEGKVTFNTAANKLVISSEALTLVKPEITNISPLTVSARQDITIDGSNLDLVTKVVFNGGWEAKVKSGNASQIIVTVIPGSTDGAIKLITSNGTEVASSQLMDIVPNVPVITSIPDVGVGELLEITGTNMDVFSDIIFPGDQKATMYGQKTATLIQVYVPAKTTKGDGLLKFVTKDNEVLEKEIHINLDISKYIYNDALATDWQQWGGWGLTSQDWANTENPKAGSTAIKVVYAGSWGAIQAHPINGNVWGTYTQVKISIFGGSGSAGKSLQLYIKDTNGNMFNTTHAYTMDLAEGEWTTYTIPISALGATTVSEFVIQDKGAACTVYIDEIGLL